MKSVDSQKQAAKTFNVGHNTLNKVKHIEENQGKRTDLCQMSDKSYNHIDTKKEIAEKHLKKLILQIYQLILLNLKMKLKKKKL